jgi:hypothetical protein
MIIIREKWDKSIFFDEIIGKKKTIIFFFSFLFYFCDLILHKYKKITKQNKVFSFHFDHNFGFYFAQSTSPSYAIEREFLYTPHLLSLFILTMRNVGSNKDHNGLTCSSLPSLNSSLCVSENGHEFNPLELRSLLCENQTHDEVKFDWEMNKSESHEREMSDERTQQVRTVVFVCCVCQTKVNFVQC